MLHLAPTLARVRSYINTHGTLDEREMKNKRNAEKNHKEYKTSVNLRNPKPNLKILTHSNVCKGTQKKEKKSQKKIKQRKKTPKYTQQKLRTKNKTSSQLVEETSTSKCLNH